MNNEIVQQLFDAIDSSNWEALEKLFHPEVVYERPGYDPFSGRERVMRFYREERILASGRHKLESVVLDGENGACWGRFVGFKKDGAAVDERFADVYSFDEGRIKARRSYFFRPAV
ncbi:MAG: hypothetical protein QOH49_2923 [Acidobacteriota bacterium]|jgi:ketosteroid isomerase-like protein|nr:hypothetical protein [Acidobacteriota bacterium]